MLEILPGCLRLAVSDISESEKGAKTECSTHFDSLWRSIAYPMYIQEFMRHPRRTACFRTLGYANQLPAASCRLSEHAAVGQSLVSVIRST